MQLVSEPRGSDPRSGWPRHRVRGSKKAQNGTHSNSSPRKGPAWQLADGMLQKGRRKSPDNFQRRGTLTGAAGYCGVQWSSEREGWQYSLRPANPGRRKARCWQSDWPRCVCLCDAAQQMLFDALLFCYQTHTPQVLVVLDTTDITHRFIYARAAPLCSVECQGLLDETHSCIASFHCHYSFEHQLLHHACHIPTTTLKACLPSQWTEPGPLFENQQLCHYESCVCVSPPSRGDSGRPLLAGHRGPIAT